MNISKINNSIALFITKLVSTMWCVYLFSMMVLIPFFIPSTLTIIQFISSAFLQLVFLPLILVGQNVQGEKTETRAEEDHENLLAELQEIKDMHQDLHKLLENFKLQNS